MAVLDPCKPKFEVFFWLHQTNKAEELIMNQKLID
jgi:hypothetical protein